MYVCACAWERESEREREGGRERVNANMPILMKSRRKAMMEEPVDKKLIAAKISWETNLGRTP